MPIDGAFVFSLGEVLMSLYRLAASRGSGLTSIQSNETGPEETELAGLPITIAITWRTENNVTAVRVYRNGACGKCFVTPQVNVLLLRAPLL